MVYKKVLFLPKTERKKKIKNKFKKKSEKWRKNIPKKSKRKLNFFEKKNRNEIQTFSKKKCEIKIESNTPKDAIWKGPPTTVSWNEHSPVPTPTLIQQGPCASRFLRKIKKYYRQEFVGHPLYSCRYRRRGDGGEEGVGINAGNVFCVEKGST